MYYMIFVPVLSWLNCYCCLLRYVIFVLVRLVDLYNSQHVLYLYAWIKIFWLLTLDSNRSGVRFTKLIEFKARIWNTCVENAGRMRGCQFFVSLTITYLTRSRIQTDRVFPWEKRWEALWRLQQKVTGLTFTQNTLLRHTGESMIRPSLTNG